MEIITGGLITPTSQQYNLIRILCIIPYLHLNTLIISMGLHLPKRHLFRRLCLNLSPFPTHIL